LALVLGFFGSVLGFRLFVPRAIWHRDHHVRWQFVAGPTAPSLRACSGGNLLDALLAEFAATFDEPQGLPPARPCDHRITLVPGVSSVGVRPYRYLVTHKDELEKQCTNMLQ